jgi:Ca2+/Na+ antiporter
MKSTEVLRWGVPVLGFAAYVKWGGVSLALLFALILFAGISGLIHWRHTNPSSFYRHIRAIVVMFVLLPSIAATVIGALSGLLGLIVALPVLGFALWLTRWANRNAARAPVAGTPSMAAQNLEAANDLTAQIIANARRSQTRGAQLHVQADNLALIKRNQELEAQSAALQEQLRARQREAALPPDPFADPIPKA